MAQFYEAFAAVSVIAVVQCLSPSEFRKLYATTDKERYNYQAPPPFNSKKPIYGYIAPTNTPSYVIPSPNRFKERYPYAERFATKPTIYERRTPPSTFYNFRDRPNGFLDSAVDTSTSVEDIQNLVHLRNLHSLTNRVNPRRKTIPYGIIRNGKQFWKEENRDEEKRSKRHLWAAQAIITDQVGQESLIIERGVRYKGPNPLLEEPEDKYDAIEIDIQNGDDDNSFRERRGFRFETETLENSITKRPANTFLKRQKDAIKDDPNKSVSDIQNQVDSPSTRGFLRPLDQPVTFRTKVVASIGIEPDNLLTPPNSAENHSPHSTPAQQFEPLISPPANNHVNGFFPSGISTTAQNEQLAVLPSPHDSASQGGIFSTESNLPSQGTRQGLPATSLYGSGAMYNFIPNSSTYGSSTTNKSPSSANLQHSNSFQPNFGPSVSTSYNTNQGSTDQQSYGQTPSTSSSYGSIDGSSFRPSTGTSYGSSSGSTGSMYGSSPNSGSSYGPSPGSMYGQNTPPPGPVHPNSRPINDSYNLSESE